MDKNFRVRVIVGTIMFVGAAVGLCLFNGLPFRILYWLFTAMALVELLSFFKKKFSRSSLLFAILEILFLIGGVIFTAEVGLKELWCIIIGVPGYDIFAYLFGKMFGGKIFGKARPFPRISKNKTWEGTIFGLIMAMGLVAILLAVHGDLATSWIYLLCGPLALIGDLFESYLKRTFKIKDSNEVIIKNKFFEKLELCVGGAEGHGGFLDRIDSVAFAMTILLLISLI